MKNQTIQSIRKNIGKIRVSHYRKIKGEKELVPISVIRENGWQNHIESKGGKTVLSLTTNEGKDFSAESVCSKHDHFCRRTANSIAIGRLIKQLENK